MSEIGSRRGVSQVRNMDMRIGDICEDGDKLWFYDSIHQLICYTDRDLHKIHVENRISTQDVEDAGAGIFTAWFDKKLFIVFHRKNVIITYSILSKEYSVSLFDRKQGKEKGKNIHRFGNCLYMFPSKIDGTVLVFYMDRGIFEEVTWMENDDPAFGMECLFSSIDREKVFFPVYKKGIVIELSLPDFQYVSRYYNDMAIGTVCYDEGRMWMTQTTSTELACVGESGKFEKAVPGCGEYEEFFSRLVVWKKKIAAIPRYGDYVLIYDCDSKKSLRIAHDAFKAHEKGSSLTYGYYCTGSLLYLLPWSIPRLLCVDMERGKIDERELKIDIREYLSLLCIDSICIEGEVVIEDYLGWLVAGGEEQRIWKKAEEETSMRTDGIDAIWRVLKVW